MRHPPALTARANSQRSAEERPPAARRECPTGHGLRSLLRGAAGTEPARGAQRPRAQLSGGERRSAMCRLGQLKSFQRALLPAASFPCTPHSRAARTRHRRPRSLRGQRALPAPRRDTRPRAVSRPRPGAREAGRLPAPVGSCRRSARLPAALWARQDPCQASSVPRSVPVPRQLLHSDRRSAARGGGAERGSLPPRGRRPAAGSGGAGEVMHCASSAGGGGRERWSSGK